MNVANQKDGRDYDLLSLPARVTKWMMVYLQRHVVGGMDFLGEHNKFSQI